MLCACAKIQGEYSDRDMINLAKSYQKLFHLQSISRVQLHSDYYICAFNDSSTYIVSCDSRVIRDINNQLEIISVNAENDTCLPNNMQSMLMIVKDIFQHNISLVQVDSNIIRIERFDRYCITNIEPYSLNTYEKVQNSWYIKYSKNSSKNRFDK